MAAEIPSVTPDVLITVRVCVLGVSPLFLKVSLDMDYCRSQLMALTYMNVGKYEKQGSLVSSPSLSLSPLFSLTPLSPLSLPLNTNFRVSDRRRKPRFNHTDNIGGENK